jgi:hypothetical protein
VSKRKSVKKNPVRETPATEDCDGFDGQMTKVYGKPFRWSGRTVPKLPERVSPWSDKASDRPDKWLET